MFESWHLAAIDRAGYNGIRDEHIDRVAESLHLAANKEIKKVWWIYGT